jgi:hypothetical protein
LISAFGAKDGTGARRRIPLNAVTAVAVVLLLRVVRRKARRTARDGARDQPARIFPIAYPAYRSATKMLIPCVL